MTIVLTSGEQFYDVVKSLAAVLTELVHDILFMRVRGFVVNF